MTVGQIVVRKMAEAQGNANKNRRAGRLREASYWIGAVVGVFGIAVALNARRRISAAEFSAAGRKYGAALTLWEVVKGTQGHNPGARRLDPATVAAFERFLREAGVA